MVLTKNGMVYELNNPIHISAFLNNGWDELKTVAKLNTEPDNASVIKEKKSKTQKTKTE